MQNNIFNKEYHTAGFRIKSGMTGNEEQGRSMVEMLGVLAVMGVLSVGGVAMYTSAMNKHRANELLNEASKRAAAVAAQISMQGKEANDNLIADFTNPSGYTFGVAKKNANQFNITINAVDNDICIQMKTASGTNTPIRKINNECTELTYNNDMSTTVWASDYETKSACETAGKTWCGGFDSCSEEECCAGKAVGECQKCNSAGAVLESAAEGTTCDYSTEGDGVCHNGTCVPKSTEANCVAGGVRCNDTTYGECCPTGYFCTTNGDVPGVCKKFTSGCSTNDDCTGSNQYCQISASSGGIVKSGTCKPLGTPVSASIFGLGNVIVSPGKMNWWSTKNWCEAQGKHLINIEDFQVYRSGTTTKVVANTALSYGCASGKTCGNWHDIGMWKGNGDDADARTLTSAGETLQANYSPVLVALAKEFRGPIVFWTASDFNNDSYNAFAVFMYRGSVSGYNSRSLDAYALCE